MTISSTLRDLMTFRRASRARKIEDARRLARLEVEVDALHAQVIVNSLILGTTPAGTAKTSAPRPHAIITAEQRRTADAICETYAAELWTPAERQAFRSLKADENGGAS